MPRGIDLEIDLGRIFQRNEPQVIFDVGANTGQTSLRFAKCFPRSEIYTFEPIQSTYKLLEENTKNIPSIHCYHLALGEKDGKAFMHLGEESQRNRVLGKECSTSNGATQEVEMAQLDSFCRDHKLNHVDLLKTDCEGYDLQVLLGAREILSKGGIKLIFCEVNFRRDASHADFFKIEEYLSSFEFVFYGLYDYSGWYSHIPTSGFMNALFVKKDLWPET